MSPYELFIGLRYTRAKRRNHFISFISLISLLGITLGMTALITVMSVMNGFQKEVRARILGVASHIQISGFDGRLTDWRQVAHEALKHPQVEAAAPYVSSQGMISFNNVVSGVVVRGIVPDMEDRVADLGRMMIDGKLEDLVPGRIWYCHRPGIGAISWRIYRGQDGADFASGTGDAGRHIAATQTIHCYRYFRSRPFRIRLRSGAHPFGRRAEALSYGK